MFFVMNGMERKVLNDVERVSLIMLEMGLWDFFFFFFVWAVLAALSWPYLWLDQRTRGKERPLALLWSELLKKKGRYVANHEKG